MLRLFLFLLLTGCSSAPYVPSQWRAEVPVETRALADPLTPSHANLGAGRDAYSLYCASCHAEDGAGRRGRPDLRTARVHSETDGELYWILKNGSKGHGMPAWRSLGDTSLWQLVEYIRSLPPGPS